MANATHSRRLRLAAALVASLCLATTALAAEGRLVEEVVHSAALEGNLLGDSPDRNVTVYLPPGYDDDPAVRYPAVYLLHGYWASNRVWMGGEYLSISIQAIADRLIEQGTMKPMIIVMPSAANRYKGAWYTNSLVAGHWEDFLTRDLVLHVDSTYRTLSQVASRGIAGHSMGGAEALRVAMKYPELFHAAYGMSASPMGFNTAPDFHHTSDWIRVVALDQASQFNSLGLYGQAVISAAASFSPNPDHPPFLVDLPFESVGGELKQVEGIWQRWLIHDPVAMVAEGQVRTQELAAIHFDCGTADEVLVDSRAYADALTAAGVAHVFETYDGGHLNRIAERVETRMLPFFSAELEFEATATSVETASWAVIKGAVREFADGTPVAGTDGVTTGNGGAARPVGPALPAAKADVKTGQR